MATLHARRLFKGRAIPAMELRARDVLECAAGGLTPEEALRQSVDGSLEAYAMYYKDQLVCMWGYRPSTFMGETAHMWMLGSHLIFLFEYKVARESLRIVNYVLEKYPKLSVLVHTDYDLSVEWLSWLGFEIASTEGNFHTMTRGR